MDREHPFELGDGLKREDTKEEETPWQPVIPDQSRGERELVGCRWERNPLYMIGTNCPCDEKKEEKCTPG